MDKIEKIKSLIDVVKDDYIQMLEDMGEDVVLYKEAIELIEWEFGLDLQ